MVMATNDAAKTRPCLSVSWHIFVRQARLMQQKVRTGANQWDLIESSCRAALAQAPRDGNLAGGARAASKDRPSLR